MGNPIRTCNKSGMWSGSNPSCVYASKISRSETEIMKLGLYMYAACGVLTNPENGNVIYSLYLETLKATYTCKAPLKLIGYSYRTCSRWFFFARWSGDAPRCECAFYYLVICIIRGSVCRLLPFVKSFQEWSRDCVVG